MAEEHREQVVDEEPEKLSGEGGDSLLKNSRKQASFWFPWVL